MHWRIIGFTIAATVLYLFGNGVSAEEVDCHRLGHEICVKPVEERLPRLFPFFPTDSELKEYCEPLLFVIRCTMEFSKTCPFTKAEFEPVRGMEELAPLLEDICNENSSMGKAYRENIHCVSVIKDNIEDRMLHSAYQFMESMGKLRTDPSERFSEKQWRAARCTFNNYIVRQVLALTVEECGAETTMFMPELLSRMLPSYEDLCPDDDDEMQGFISILEQNI